MVFKSILLITIGSLFIVAGCKRLGHRGASAEKRAEWAVKKISSELDLNEDQKVLLNNIKDELLTKRKELKSMGDDLSDSLLAQVNEESIDPAELNSLFESKESQFTEMRSLMVEKFTEFHAALTPEQRTKMAEKLSKIKKHKRRHRRG